MLPKLGYLVASTATALLLSSSPAAASSSGVSVSHGVSSREMAHEIAKRLETLSRNNDTREFSMNTTSLDTSWNSAVLFQLEGTVEEKAKRAEQAAADDGKKKNKLEQSVSGAFAVSVTCETCYIKGDVDARLTLGESFNINDTLHTLEDQASDVFDNITDWVHDFNVSFSDRTIDIPPPPDIDFNLPLDNMPEAVLEFSISGAEIYVELSTVFVDSITYRLTLYIQQGLGVELTDDLFLGLVPTLDLILSVDAELEIRHGFHIRFDEDILIKLAMFSEEAADLHFNGGTFEFLPVEVVAGKTVIQAVVQLSMRAGFALELDLFPGPDAQLGPLDTADLVAKMGLETRVYANVANFKSTLSLDEDDSDCDGRVEQVFQFDVGAAAGAYIGIAGETWGPSPATEVPLFPRTFTSCLTDSATPSSVEATATATATEAARLRARQDDDDDEDEELTTTTLERKVTNTAVQCGEVGLINCPAAKMTHQEQVTTLTHVTAVPSGVEPEFPESITAAAVSTSTFGKDAVPMTTSSGKPKPTQSDDDDDDDDGSISTFFSKQTGGVSNKLIIGLSVGLGVPFLIALVAGLCLWRRKSKKTMAPYTSTSYEAVKR